MTNLDHLFRQFPCLNPHEQLVLRDPRRSDAEDYWRYINHPNVTPFIPDSCLPASPDAAKNDLQYLRDLYNKRKSIYWSLIRRDTQEMIGSCGFEHWTPIHRRGELAYDLNPEYWRRGITTLSLITLFDFAFRNMELERIEAFTLPDNIASNRCLEKLFFEQEATLKRYRFYKGEFTDILLYALTRPVYESHRQDLEETRQAIVKRLVL